MEATRVDVARGDTLVFTNTILNRLDELQASATAGGVFMAEEDCSLITEHFPDIFYKNKG